LQSEVRQAAEPRPHLYCRRDLCAFNTKVKPSGMRAPRGRGPVPERAMPGVGAHTALQS